MSELEIKLSDALVGQGATLLEYQHKYYAASEECDNFRAQLEASQASEARLREALGQVLNGPADIPSILTAEQALEDVPFNPVSAVVEAARAFCHSKSGSGRAAAVDQLQHALAALDGEGQ